MELYNLHSIEEKEEEKKKKGQASYVTARFCTISQRDDFIFTTEKRTK